MKKETEKCIDRHVRITDMSKAEQIDRIMESFNFKSFNEFFNEFLRLCLPDFYGKLCGEVEPTKKQTEERQEQEQDSRGAEILYGLQIQLLKELLLNVTIIKSVVSSMFNAKDLEYNGYAVPGEKFSLGAFGDTPEYLDSYETRALKNIRR